MIKHPDWTLGDMIRSKEWMYYEASVTDFQSLILSDPDRANRMAEGSSDEGNGCDSSTHAEHLQDERDFLKMLKVFDPDFDEEDDGDFDITKAQEEAISKEIDECEAYHEKQGTLNQEIG